MHYSVLGNHLHMIVEAKHRPSLSRGMQGLLVRVGRGLNKLWKRNGGVFADRYHDRILRTPKQVRNALCYVLCNARNHGLHLDPQSPDLNPASADPYSSSDVFDGWRTRPPEELDASAFGVVARARTWLIKKGWRRHGLLRFGETPGAT